VSITLWVSMRKLTITILLFLLIGLLVISNYVFPILSLFLKINFNPGIYHYIIVIISYLCVVLVMWFEHDKLEEFNFERLSLLLLIIVGCVRSQLNIPGEMYYRIPIYLLSLVILIAFIFNYRKIPKTKGGWVLIGLVSCLSIIPIAIINSLQGQTDPNLGSFGNGFFWNAARNLLYTVSFVAPFEEIIIRGILWGQFRRQGWNTSKVFWAQAFIFWSLHIWQLFIMPLAFLITLPIMILIFSVLVRYSKQVFPSILVHTVADAIGPLIVYFFFR
jgi:membrane protease YdiL (CAAX protease family)